MKNIKDGYSLCLNEWALDKDINGELGLLLIISSLCATTNYCYASNKYLANLFDTTEITISRKLRKLSEKGYITIEYEKRGAEVTNRYIRLTKMLTDDYQNCKPTINKNVKENNTSNNTSNNSELVENKDERTDELSNLIKFCNNNVEILTPFKCQMLEGYVDDYGIEWVQRGLEKLAGLDRTKQNVKYLGGVLKGWKKDGVPKPWESDQENKQQSSEVMHDDFGDYEMIDGYKVYL